MRLRALTISLLLVHCTADETDPLRAVQPREVRITRYAPDRAALSTRPIDIQFSESLVGPSEVGIEVPAEDLLVISPALPGRCRWVASDALRFIPEEPFAEGVRYRVEVRPSVVGARQVLAGSTTFEFPTRMFTLLSTEVTPRPDARTARVVLEFSHAVRAAEAGAAVSFYGADGVVLPSRVVTAESGPLMTFLLGPLRGDFNTMKVGVRVDGSLRAIFGGRPLEKDVVRPIALAEEPILQIVEADAFQIAERLAIRVRLNRTVDAPTIRSALTVRPELEFGIVAVHHGFEVHAPFEANQTYTLVLDAGIQSPDGYRLPERVTASVAMPSLAPALRLTREAGPLELESVNVGRVEVRVRKVWEDNVAHLLPHLTKRTWPGNRTLGPVVYRGVVETAGRTDAVVTAVVPYDDPYPRRPGLYLVEVVDAERAWVRASTVIFDDGLTLNAKIGSSTVRAEVRTPDTLRPVYGAEVRVLSRTNRRLGTTHTAPNGLAELTIDADPSDPPTWIIAHRDRAFAYLPLPQSVAIDGQADAGRGRAYVFGDRSSYHAGETIQLGVLVRDDALRAPSSPSVTLEVRNRLGAFVDVAKPRRAIDGAMIFDIPLPDDAQPGRYEVRALGQWNAVLGRHTFWVEEPTPPRLVADTRFDPSQDGPRAPGFVVEGRYRLGEKATAGLVLRTRCRYREQPVTSESFDTFTFARSTGRPLDLVEREVETRLDADGRAQRYCPAVRAAGAAGPVTITLEASIVEPGGRVVKDEAWVTHQPTPHYVGVRRRPDVGPASVGEDAGLEVVVLGPNGNSLPNLAFSATVRSLDGVAAPAEVALSSTSRAVRIPYVTREPGRHLVEVTTADGASTSMMFWVLPDEGSEVPAPDGQLVLVGRRVDHETDDVANFLVWSPRPGRIDLTVERDRVLWQRRIDVDSMVSSVQVPVLTSFLPNANVVARLTSGRRVAYASAPLSVSTKKNRLELRLETPSKATAGKPLSVKLVSPDATNAHAIVWAVPERRLDPKVDRPADPVERFVGRQPIELSTHDLLAVTADGPRRDRRRNRRRRPRVEWATGRAVWSQIVPLNGTAAIDLELPFVNGPVRVAAVAFERDRFGAANRTVDVQDPLRLETSTPRFLRPSDRLQLPVEVENGLDRRADVDFGVDVRGPIAATASANRVVLEPRAKERQTVELTARKAVGVGRLIVRASAGTSSTTIVRRVSVVPSRAPVIVGSVHEVDRPRPLTLDLPTDFVSGSAQVSLTIGPSALHGYRAALEAVLTDGRTTPRAAVDEVMALLAARSIKSESSALVRPALERLAAYGGGRNAMESAKYALVVFEAVRAGYAVDRAAVDRARQRMHAVVTAPKKASDPLTLALAHYGLALSDRPERRLLIELAELWTAEESTVDPRARSVLGAAAMKAGMLTLGRKLFVDDLAPSRELDALVLTVLAEVLPFHPTVQRLTEALRGRAVEGKWVGREENAFALAAVRKGARVASGDRPYWGTVLVDGEPLVRFNTKRTVDLTVPLAEWRRRVVQLEVTGAGRAFVGVTVHGVPAAEPEVVSKGLEVDRARFTVTGDRIDGPLPFGELVVTGLTVRCTHTTTCGRVVVDERVVAGLEIEEPQLYGLGWLSRGAGRPRTTVEEDRLRYEMVLDEGDTLHAYYSARAIAAGSFTAPGLDARAMDDHAVQATAAAVRLEIER